MWDYLLSLGFETLGIAFLIMAFAFSLGVGWHHFMTVLKSLKGSVDLVAAEVGKAAVAVERVERRVAAIERRIDVVEALMRERDPHA